MPGDLGLFVVSDGMGGHLGGEVASSTAVEVIQSFISKQLLNNKIAPTEKMIAEAIQAANKAIFDKSLKDKSLQGMGTTTTALLFEKAQVFIGHVGDSRCYFFRPDSVWQLTRDHSLVQEKLRAGLISRAQVKTDKMKNVITRSVGYEEYLEVETYQMHVQSGDCFLICSDGLSGLVDEPEVLKIVSQGMHEKGNLQETVEKLIMAANENGGDDNITSLLVQVA
jgi:PPM family protein phosphatase